MEDYNINYNLLVYAGRFQLPHNGHFAVIKQALSYCDRLVILVGSANQPRSVSNPFSYRERVDLISAGLSQDQLNVITFHPLNDFVDDRDWVASVDSAITDAVEEYKNWYLGNNPITKAIIGFNKDASSFYLNLVASSLHLNVIHADMYSASDNGKQALSSSQLRPLAFDAYNLHGWHDLLQYVPDPVVGKIQELKNSSQCNIRNESTWSIVQNEIKAADRYKAAWSTAPYPPTFVTADAVVLWGEYVLLIERGNYPGKGLLAVPGGFLEQQETLLDCAVRELFEESGIKMSVELLKKALIKVRVVDTPNRDVRGRMITHVHVFDLELVAKELPELMAGDDAAKANWVNLAELTPSNMFADHFALVVNSFTPIEELC